MYFVYNWCVQAFAKKKIATSDSVWYGSRRAEEVTNVVRVQASRGGYQWQPKFMYVFLFIYVCGRLLQQHVRKQFMWAKRPGVQRRLPMMPNHVCFIRLCVQAFATTKTLVNVCPAASCPGKWPMVTNGCFYSFMCAGVCYNKACDNGVFVPNGHVCRAYNQWYLMYACIHLSVQAFATIKRATMVYVF